MTRKTIIAGNWKMHKTIRETIDFLEELLPKVKKSTCEVRIAPPFTALSVAANAIKGSHVQIGAQNMSEAEEGAFTGEVSSRMLKDAGAQFVILGHSERRALFGETDELIHAKLQRAFQEGLPPILCIGETEQQRESNQSVQVLTTQIDKCLKEFSREQLETLVIAYEPVWAIGTGKTATPEMAQETHQAIRAHIAKIWGGDFADQLSLLYGGSVKPDNIDALLNQPDIDGALIGGASLDAATFGQMVQR